MERPTTCAEDEGEFVFHMPDAASQILVLELARSRGLVASIPGRSHRRVAVRARKQEADSLTSEARRLVNQLHVMQVKAVEQVLEENGISVSLGFSFLVAALEPKAADAMGGSKREATSHRAREGHQTEP